MRVNFIGKEPNSDDLIILQPLQRLLHNYPLKQKSGLLPVKGNKENLFICAKLYVEQLLELECIKVFNWMNHFFLKTIRQVNVYNFIKK